MDGVDTVSGGKGERVGFLAALVAAVAGIGLSRWAKRSGVRIDCERRYLPLVQRTMREVSKATGLTWRKGTRVALRVVEGKRLHHGYWQVLVREADGRERWQHAWTYAEASLIGVAGEEKTLAIGHGRMSGLGHELAHKIYEQAGVAWGEHHARMKRDGILWEQR